MITAIGASSAMASGTGGVSASEPTSAPAPSPAKKLHLDPVTSRSRSVAYDGPVYLKTATGEVVPFQASTGTTTTAASPTTGTAASVTGGSTATSPTTPAPPAPTALTLPPLTGYSSATGPVARPDLLVPGTMARYVDGLAAAPMSAPAAIQQIIWAANELIGLPYIYGGGHGSWISPGYDCSGTVSFALHGADLLSAPEDSSEFEHYGSHGIGRWVTIFANPEHAYMTVAGLRLDTSAADDPSDQQGPRWRPLRPANEGFVVRHPRGL